MKPIDYILKNLSHLNMTILKQIITDAGETVSEEIYDYLKETPLNTNTAILKQMGLDIEKSSEDESGEDMNFIMSGVITEIIEGDDDEGTPPEIRINDVNPTYINNLKSIKVNDTLALSIADNSWVQDTVDQIAQDSVVESFFEIVMDTCSIGVNAKSNNVQFFIKDWIVPAEAKVGAQVKIILI